MITIETKAIAFMGSETELDTFLLAWEAGTLLKADWTHAAHVVVAAAYTWNLGLGNPRAGGMMMLGVLGGLAAAIATTFRPTWAPITTPIYAALEGFALGGISLTFEARYPGLVAQAVFLTFGTLGALLLAYRSGVIRATENLKLGSAMCW